MIKHRLKVATIVSENQSGFMPGRSTMEAKYLLRRLVKKFREKRKDLLL